MTAVHWFGVAALVFVVSVLLLWRVAAAQQKRTRRQQQDREKRLDEVAERRHSGEVPHASPTASGGGSISAPAETETADPVPKIVPPPASSAEPSASIPLPFEESNIDKASEPLGDEGTPAASPPVEGASALSAEGPAERATAIPPPPPPSASPPQGPPESALRDTGVAKVLREAAEAQHQASRGEGAEPATAALGTNEIEFVSPGADDAQAGEPSTPTSQSLPAVARTEEALGISQAEPVAPIAPVAAVQAAPAGADRRVVLIEDSETMRVVIERVLRGEPYSLAGYAQAPAALDAARQAADCIVVDLSLAPDDGFAVAQQIRDDRALTGIPLLLLHSRDEVPEDELRRVGFKASLRKPFSSQQLLDALAGLFEGATATETPAKKATEVSPTATVAQPAMPPPPRSQAAQTHQAAEASVASTPSPTPSQSLHSKSAEESTQRPVDPDDVAVKAQPEETPVDSPAPVSSAHGATKRVLLVEDSATMRKVVEYVFNGQGFDVTSLESAEGAVETAEQMRPDLVIADLSLSGTDGYDLCRLLREKDDTGTVPVLLLHGPAVDYDEAKAKEVAADDVLQKPFSSDALLEKARSLTK